MHNDTQIILLVSMIILILTITIAVFVIVRRKQQKKMGKPGVFGDFTTKVPVKFTHQEIDFKYSYHDHANKSPSYLSIETTCRTIGAFRIKKETRIEKFFKWLNVSKEIQTGDFNFDDQLYIITEEPKFTERALFSSQIRHAINTLFSMGITHITVNTNQINAIIEPFDKKLSKTSLLEIAELLNIIVSQLPENNRSIIENTTNTHPYRIPQHRDHPFKGPWSGKRFFSYAASVALIVFGLIIFAIGISTFPPLDPGIIFIDSLNYSISLLIFVTWLMIILLKGRSNSHIDFIVLFSFNLFAVPLSTVGTMYYLNGSQDHSQMVQHEEVIHHKYYRSNKNSKTYYISVNSWREGVNVEDIQVNWSIWQQSNVNQSKVVLSTKQGYLGYEWLQNYTLID